MPNNNRRIAVVGGGPAGMMAGGVALEGGAEVVLFEQNAKLGRKLAITGKGRCNVTNDSSMQEILANIPRNPRFLYTAFSAFSAEDTKRFFESRGVPLKTERGRRVFPVSDRAEDIVAACRAYVRDARIVRERVLRLCIENGACIGLETVTGFYPFDAVIVATGGMSYPGTGSDGNGYALARAAGHSITEIMPSLVPLEAELATCRALQGLSLRNVGISIRHKKTQKTVYTDFGEMLFTHFGVSGPTILSASAHLHGFDLSELCLHIDLKPALDLPTLERRILSDFAKYQNKDLANALHDLLPSKMIDVVVHRMGTSPEKKIHSVTKEERKRLMQLLKDFTVDLHGLRPIEEAIVTSGGVNVKEVAPGTMMSKKVNGLYFAGEILDVDAYTGGFNLQIAFSTGYLAGLHASREGKETT